MGSQSIGGAISIHQNETKVFSFSNSPASSFPHFKKSIPMDQKNKLIAMHKAGKLNAGIYVAIVLAVYLFLLTLILCRYSRKHHRNYLDDSTRPLHPSLCSCEDGPFLWFLYLGSYFDKKEPPKTNSTDLDPEDGKDMENTRETTGARGEESIELVDMNKRSISPKNNLPTTSFSSITKFLAPNSPGGSGTSTVV